MSELAEEIELHDNQGLRGIFSPMTSVVVVSRGLPYIRDCWMLGTLPYCIAHILLSLIVLHRFRTSILIRQRIIKHAE
jgi:hypothetical protein